MSINPGETVSQGEIDPRLILMAADFVAETDMFEGLTLPARVEVVNGVAALAVEAENALEHAPDKTSYLSYVGYDRGGSRKAIVDRGLKTENGVQHNIRLWKIEHLKKYMAHFRDKQEAGTSFKG